MNKRRRWLVILMASACVLQCAACGSNEKVGESSTEGGITAENEKIILNVWGWNDDKECMEAVAETYMKEHPDVQINYTFSPVKEYNDKLTTALSGNDDIDIFCINSVAPYSQLVSRNQLLNLDSYIEQSGIDTAMYGDMFSNYKYNGSNYVLPYRNSVIVVAYNKDMFDAAGVEYPKDGWTWDDLYEKAQQMTSGEGADKIYGLWYHNRTMDYCLPALQKGWNLLSTDDEHLNLLTECVQKKIDAQNEGTTIQHSEITATGQGIRAAFESEMMAMYITGDWTVNQLRSSAKEGTINFDWDFVPVPNSSNGASGTMVQPVFIGINPSTQKKEAAWDFMSYFAGTEGAKIFAGLGTMPGALLGNGVKEAYIGDGTLPPENVACLFSQTTYDPYIINNYLTEIENILKEETEIAFIGEQTAREAVDNFIFRTAEYRDN